LRNVSDIIEDYLKTILTKSDQDLIEIKRSELARMFQCVPSQINYVISTRFTAERGYMVESKRGGGGFIRIIKVQPHDEVDLLNHMIKLIGNQISQMNAESVISRLFEEEVLTKRESNLMVAAMERSLYHVTTLHRDHIRANILKAMLHTLKYKEMS